MKIKIKHIQIIIIIIIIKEQKNFVLRDTSEKRRIREPGFASKRKKESRERRREREGKRREEKRARKKEDNQKKEDNAKRRALYWLNALISLSTALSSLVMVSTFEYQVMHQTCAYITRQQ